VLDDMHELASHREGRIDPSVEVDALEVLAHQRQAGLAAQVVGQWFEHEIGHHGLHLEGETQTGIKSLISRLISMFLTARSRIQGIVSEAQYYS